MTDWFKGLQFRRHDRLLRMLPRVIETALVTAIGLLVWHTAYPYFKNRGTAPAPLPLAPSKTPVPLDLTPLIRAHLFGVVATPSVTQTVAPPRDIHVLGLITSDTPGLSSAIVADNGDPHTLHVGDQLPDGSTLITIAPNAITLRRGNGTALVPFDLHPAPMDARFTTLDVTRSTTDEATTASTNTATAPAPADTPTVQNTQGQLKALRARALQQLLKRVRQQPVPPATPPG